MNFSRSKCENQNDFIFIKFYENPSTANNHADTDLCTALTDDIVRNSDYQMSR